MKADPGDGGREKARDCLARLLKEKDFVAAHCSPDHKPGTTLLYRDPELDFNVLAHCFKGGAKSPPHDHGTSWAIYGQALGHTNVVVWKRKDGAKGDKQNGPADLDKIDQYELNAGDAGVFHPGIVHTVEFTPGSRYIRVTGTDLNKDGAGRLRPRQEGRRAGQPGGAHQRQRDVACASTSGNSASSGAISSARSACCACRRAGSMLHTEAAEFCGSSRTAAKRCCRGRCRRAPTTSSPTASRYCRTGPSLSPTWDTMAASGRAGPAARSSRI